VRLFVDRARRARPTFTVDEENAPAIAQICHRLDGITPPRRRRCPGGPRRGCGRETGDRWRFGFEQRAVDSAWAAVGEALGTDAAAAAAEGRDLDWVDAAALVGRARGRRGRPRTGWASLTPTEREVAALVAEGLTNPQIAERLLVGRATVKTHVEHIFAKLGTRSRSELAVVASRHAGAAS
jgi:DNA-binding CsgD family transcriptional regulator